MKRAILMARVSSDEQAKGYSLDIQIDKLSAHCTKESIGVVNVFREDHSAKNFNRPEFTKMLLFLKKNKGKVDLLLVTTWDRFSRNLSHSFAMIDKLRQLGVEVQAIDQPLDLSVPENLMILSVYLALPDIDNKRRSIKITEGVRAAKTAGRWLGVPPFGYAKARDENGRSVLVPGEKAALVQTAFALIASGKAQAEVRALLAKQGHHFARTTFSEFLRNQVFIGNIWVQSEKGGFYVKGLHQPLVDEATFKAVQERLEGHIQKKNISKVRAFQEELHLRGMLLCEGCGRHLTGSASRGRNGQRHHYYHCNHCHQVRLRADTLHQRVEAILGEFKGSDQAIKLYERMLKKQLLAQSERKRPQQTIQEEIRVNEQRLKNIEDDFADRLIDADTFHRSRTRYVDKIKNLKQEMQARDGGSDSLQTVIKKGLHLLLQLPQFYKKSSVEVKREIIGSIFPEKIQISETGSRTTRINEAILLIAATSKDSSKKKTGQPFENLELSGVVEVTGVEPVSKHDIQKLSTCLFLHCLSGNGRGRTNQSFP